MQFSSEALNDLFLLLSGASAVIWPTVIAVALYLLESEREESECVTTRIKVNCRRISVLEVYTSMGPRVFWRTFRMKFDSFWPLYSILSTHISTATLEGRNYVPKGGRDGGNYSLPPIPNGEIPSNSSIRGSVEQELSRSDPVRCTSVWQTSRTVGQWWCRPLEALEWLETSRKYRHRCRLSWLMRDLFRGLWQK
jgi:hypothetical protein